jgi:hypothetical protein
LVNPADVEKNLRAELSWAREALRPHLRSGKAAETVSMEDRDASFFIRDVYRLHPDGVTMEKRQEYVAPTVGIALPKGHILFSTHWVVMDAEGRLKFGQESRNVPKEKLR